MDLKKIGPCKINFCVETKLFMVNLYEFVKEV